MHCISVMSFALRSSEHRKARKGKTDEKDYGSIFSYTPRERQVPGVSNQK
jgi:hypothetical protein